MGWFLCSLHRKRTLPGSRHSSLDAVCFGVWLLYSALTPLRTPRRQRCRVRLTSRALPRDVRPWPWKRTEILLWVHPDGCGQEKPLHEALRLCPVLTLMPELDFIGWIWAQLNFQLNKNIGKEPQAIKAVIAVMNSHATLFLAISKYIFPFLIHCCYPCLI